MIKLFISLLLLIPTLAFASGGMGPGPGFYVASGGGDETFYCEFEGSDDGTTYTMGGNDSSDGDTTGTLVSDATLASNGNSGRALNLFGGYDSMVFDITSDDLASPNAGTIEMDLYFDGVMPGASSDYIVVDTSSPGTDGIWLEEFDGGGFRFQVEGNNTYVYARASGAAFGGLVINTWYHVTIKWDDSRAAGDQLYVNCNGVTIGSNSANTTITAMTNSLNALKIGNRNSSAAQTVRIDNVKVYQSWQ